MTDEMKPASAGQAEPCLPPRLNKPRLLTRETSEYLLEVHGVKMAPATLAKLRSIGGGPPFEKFGATVLYQPRNLDAWALDKLGEPKSSTSDEARS